MCGRYVLSLYPSQVRRRLQDQDMPAYEAPDDDDDRVRQTYNFAPGYHGLIYRAYSADREAPSDGADDNESQNDGRGESPSKRPKTSHGTLGTQRDEGATKDTIYKLQAAKWGLVPFWTKRQPDFGSQMRTINCRDDSLIENRGMWNTMKQRKRCVVVAEGFFEWLKRNNGKEKIPHFIKRKDGQLMCFAGLWDMVQYEGSEEKLYTYTIITTDSNSQLKFLHHRMPVMLEPGSKAMKAWLDPDNVGWSKELQSILRPFRGQLECYPVDKAVGKVGNNSSSFVVPIDSKENKNNIANFFGTQGPTLKNATTESQATGQNGSKAEKMPDEDRETAVKVENSEDNAPLPKPKGETDEELSQEIKTERDESNDSNLNKSTNERVERGIKREHTELDDADAPLAADGQQQKSIKVEHSSPSPIKKSSPLRTANRKTRDATSNHSVAKTPSKDGNAKITSFFGGK